MALKMKTPTPIHWLLTLSERNRVMKTGTRKMRRSVSWLGRLTFCRRNSGKGSLGRLGLGMRGRTEIGRASCRGMSVDLGGRRIIKKKKRANRGGGGES